MVRGTGTHCNPEGERPLWTDKDDEEVTNCRGQGPCPRWFDLSPVPEGKLRENSLRLSVRIGPNVAVSASSKVTAEDNKRTFLENTAIRLQSQNQKTKRRPVREMNGSAGGFSIFAPGMKYSNFRRISRNRTGFTRSVSSYRRVQPVLFLFSCLFRERGGQSSSRQAKKRG